MDETEQKIEKLFFPTIGSIDPMHLTPENWLALIETAVENIPLNEQAFNILKHMQSEVMDYNILEAERQGDWKQTMRSNPWKTSEKSSFWFCGFIRHEFLNDDCLIDEALMLNRDGKFYVLRSVWDVTWHEKARPTGMRLILKSWEIRDAFDERLANILKRAPLEKEGMRAMPLGYQIMHHLNKLITKTSQQASAKAKEASKTDRKFTLAMNLFLDWETSLLHERTLT